jgi:hypothetical protein
MKIKNKAGAFQIDTSFSAFGPGSHCPWFTIRVDVLAHQQQKINNP